MTNTSRQLRKVLKSKKFQALVKDAGFQIRFGIEVYEKRMSKNWSQKLLAKTAQTTQRIISQIEDGDINIGISLLGRIASTLDFTGDSFRKVFKLGEDGVGATVVYLDNHFVSFQDPAPDHFPAKNKQDFGMTSESKINFA